MARLQKKQKDAAAAVVNATTTSKEDAFLKVLLLEYKRPSVLYRPRLLPRKWVERGGTARLGGAAQVPHSFRRDSSAAAGLSGGGVVVYLSF